MHTRFWVYIAAMLALVVGRGANAAPKRTMPDYDGRGERPRSVGDTLIWAPGELSILKIGQRNISSMASPAYQ